MKEPSVATLGLKKWRETCEKWPNFKKNWVIEANLEKLFGLPILKMCIKKIINLLAFTCFVFHVNMFCSFWAMTF